MKFIWKQLIPDWFVHKELIIGSEGNSKCSWIEFLNGNELKTQNERGKGNQSKSKGIKKEDEKRMYDKGGDCDERVGNGR